MRASVASRFLGFSYGEILGTTVAAVVLLGPKDVPMLAKILGTNDRENRWIFARLSREIGEDTGRIGGERITRRPERNDEGAGERGRGNTERVEE